MVAIKSLKASSMEKRSKDAPKLPHSNKWDIELLRSLCLSFCLNWGSPLVISLFPLPPTSLAKMPHLERWAIKSRVTIVFYRDNSPC